MSDTELLLKPNVGSEAEPPLRRVEVFTGTGRRRRWTPEQKALIIAETYESGETVSTVARRHGLTAQQLFTWRRNAQQARAGRILEELKREIARFEAEFQAEDARTSASKVRH
jgi:transposase-like protein